VAGGWRKLRNEEHLVRFPTYYYSDIMEEDKIGGACSTHGTDKCIRKFSRKI
jgi:hypothetical protein